MDSENEITEPPEETKDDHLPTQRLLTKAVLETPENRIDGVAVT